MNGEPYSAMRETMRLMKSGDLLAATAAIQQQLGAAPAAEPSPAAGSSGQDPIEGTFQVVDDNPPAKDTEARGAPAADSVAEARTQFSEHTYSGLAGTRRYKLFIPTAYHGQPLPLVVMLHGCTQTPDDFATGTRMNLLAEEHACFVVYPAQPQTANTSKCWNWFKVSDQRRDQGEPAIIAGLVRELLLTYGLDQDRVYVGGLSAGGAMAVILGRTYPEVFAAVGVHSGLPYAAAHDLPSALAAMKRGTNGSGDAPGKNAQAPVPTIVFHGDRDTTVHPGNGERVVGESTRASFDASDSSSPAAATVESVTGGPPGVRPYTRRIFKDGEGKIIVEHWLVHGAGHAWSGGDPRGSYTDAKGPDASRAMLRFFVERVRPSHYRPDSLS